MDGFKKITIQEYNDRCKGNNWINSNFRKEFQYENYQDFTTNEINKINKLHLVNHAEICISNYDYPHLKVWLKNKIYLNIYKLKDEWYYLKFREPFLDETGFDMYFYECDQFESVLRCIKYFMNDE